LNPNPLTPEGVRKRILVLYFAGGVNLFMAYLMWASGGSAESGNLKTAAVVFLVFAALNFYLGRKLRRQWNRFTKQAQTQPNQPNTERGTSEG
jgi:membrane protein implicated in regulation of membrane protease activity